MTFNLKCEPKQKHIFLSWSLVKRNHKFTFLSRFYIELNHKLHILKLILKFEDLGCSQPKP